LFHLRKIKRIIAPFSTEACRIFLVQLCYALKSKAFILKICFGFFSLCSLSLSLSNFESAKDLSFWRFGILHSSLSGIPFGRSAGSSLYFFSSFLNANSTHTLSHIFSCSLSQSYAHWRILKYTVNSHTYRVYTHSSLSFPHTHTHTSIFNFSSTNL
jgi:hypothetical protein